MKGNACIHLAGFVGSTVVLHLQGWVFEFPPTPSVWALHAPPMPHPIVCGFSDWLVSLPKFHLSFMLPVCCQGFQAAHATLSIVVDRRRTIIPHFVFLVFISSVLSKSSLTVDLKIAPPFSSLTAMQTLGSCLEFSLRDCGGSSSVVALCLLACSQYVHRLRVCLWSLSHWKTNDSQ